VRIELYRDQGSAAYALVRDGWPELRRSGVYHVQHTRIAALHLRACAALGAARQSSGKERAGYLKEVSRLISTLRRQPEAWAGALALLAGSGLAALSGEPELTKKTLIAALRALQESNLWLLAHAARVAGRAALLDAPADLHPEAALTWMHERGILNPIALSRALVPGLS
jgi:hypothetical protein